MWTQPLAGCIEPPTEDRACACHGVGHEHTPSCRVPRNSIGTHPRHTHAAVRPSLRVTNGLHTAKPCPTRTAGGPNPRVAVPSSSSGRSRAYPSR
jgi:hypothetical protein